MFDIVAFGIGSGSGLDQVEREGEGEGWRERGWWWWGMETRRRRMMRMESIKHAIYPPQEKILQSGTLIAADMKIYTP